MKKKVLADTNVAIALMNSSDTQHDRADKFIKKFSQQDAPDFSTMVIAEVQATVRKRFNICLGEVIAGMHKASGIGGDFRSGLAAILVECKAKDPANINFYEWVVRELVKHETIEIGLKYALDQLETQLRESGSKDKLREDRDCQFERYEEEVVRFLKEEVIGAFQPEEDADRAILEELVFASKACKYDIDFLTFDAKFFKKYCELEKRVNQFLDDRGILHFRYYDKEEAVQTC